MRGDQNTPAYVSPRYSRLFDGIQFVCPAGRAMQIFMALLSSDANETLLAPIKNDPMVRGLSPDTPV